MQEVVAGVKSILFGEEEALTPMTAPPASQPEQGYESPLKL